MKRIAIAIASFAALSMSAPVLADKGSSCHFHGSTPAKEETVLGCAAQRKDALVASGKLDASWKAVKQEKVEQVDGKKGKEWKVTFKNPAATDKDKQSLYVFLSVPGNVLAANHTGK
ncbi:MAG: DUF6488 family protein [Pseudomonadota bacterium]